MQRAGDGSLENQDVDLQAVTPCLSSATQIFCWLLGYCSILSRFKLALTISQHSQSQAVVVDCNPHLDWIEKGLEIREAHFRTVCVSQRGKDLP